MRILLSLGAIFLASLVYRAWIIRKFNTIAPPEDVAAPPEDAPEVGGVPYRVLLPPPKDDSGAAPRSPSLDDVVVVHYVGWTTDGAMFDASLSRGEAARLPLRGVILGWQRALMDMQVGEKRRIWVPAALAYGEGGVGRPGGTLVFDVHLLAIGSPPA